MRLSWIIALVLALAISLMPAAALAYSYASPKSDPLIKGRDAYLSAVAAGNWSSVESAFEAFKPQLEQLETADTSFAGDPDLVSAFTSALSAKDADAAKAALMRAYVDQINRRLSGAEANISTYQTASTLVVAAQTYFSTMQGDLSADDQKTISSEMKSALDAVGKPGVFGYGAQPADAAALKSAKEKIMSALESYAGSSDPPSDPASSGGD